MMPVMDGTEFCKKVKEDLRTSHISVYPAHCQRYHAGQNRRLHCRCRLRTLPNHSAAALLRSRVYNLLEARKRIAAQFKESIHPQQENTSDLISPLDNEFILKITAYVEERINDENINIASIADSVFMSHSTLYRKIKALTGLSTNEFIRKVRLQECPESSCHQEIQYIRSDVHGRHQQFHLFP